jgi:hypothetical protein
MTWTENTRQWLYPPEFRIGEPAWPEELAPALESLAKDLSALGGEAPGAVRMDLLAAVATRLWRMRQKMLAPGTAQPAEPMRGVWRDLESVWDQLTQAGLEVLDHTGEPFDSGLSLKVLAFQPTAGLEREVILETLKPTVYFNKQRIQIGEVIVGRPESPA